MVAFNSLVVLTTEDGKVVGVCPFVANMFQRTTCRCRAAACWLVAETAVPLVADFYVRQAPLLGRSFAGALLLVPLGV